MVTSTIADIDRALQEQGTLEPEEIQRISEVGRTLQEDAFSALYDIVFQKEAVSQLLNAWISTGNEHMIQKLDCWVGEFLLDHLEICERAPTNQYEGNQKKGCVETLSQNYLAKHVINLVRPTIEKFNGYRPFETITEGLSPGMHIH
ncbi:unnamed protein product [Allacma fusca]|uniref:Uncharacterized protein n=1 Tax=Allacma fusca TaxID=39272 RepID=A0A8J2Q1M6_9HEXA|nr:unnamed protein product [Allacma fusca]